MFKGSAVVDARPTRGYLVSRETPNLTERTTQELRQAILQLRLKPGHRLVERDLAEQTRTSRTCVRAALQQLRAEGLVARNPRGMLTVASVSPDEARQIYEVRAALESAMARLCVARASDADVAALEAAVDDLDWAVQRLDAAGIVRATTRFYDVLMRGSGNAMAHGLLASLTTRIVYLRRITAERATVEYESETAQLLRGIQRAVAERDADEAARRCEAFVARSAWFAQQVLAESEVNQPPRPEAGPDAPVPVTLPRRSDGRSGSNPRMAVRPRKI
jgi:GntR family transcriptional regulator, trigonelline degradation regulator